MNNPLFSCGLDLANLVGTSDLLRLSWEANLNLYRNSNPNGQPPSLPFYLKYKTSSPSPNCKIIAFVTSPICSKSHLQEKGDLVSSATLKETFPFFEFLCTKNYPSFSIHKAAITLFQYFHPELSLLKNQIDNSTPLIITGHSLGGSIASLFTLWLLETMNPATTKRPLCITFGSPLVGNNIFQKAISQRSTWNSCFLHVVSNQDPVPKFFISPHNPLVHSSAQTIGHKPFGTFLLCSESGCACFEDPDSIFELLVAMESQNAGSQDPNEGSRIIDYGYILNHLNSRVPLKGISELGEWITPRAGAFTQLGGIGVSELGERIRHRAGIFTELEALGVARTQQQQQNIDINNLITNIEGRESRLVFQRRKVFNPSKKLNDIKINMAYLEWYKKDSKAQGIGYYDSFKNQQTKSDIKVINYKKILTNYWKSMVAEVEKKPQREGSAFEIRWLFGGTNYRRMVEPLDIADYYKGQGKKDYCTQGRSEHYKLLEQWQKEEGRRIDRHNVKQNNVCSQTEDSCFWAYVEEAIISYKLLKSAESSPEERESSRRSLIDFEGYVMGLITNYAVSPEIFLEQSSFMQWWREYEKIIGTSYNSTLVNFMKNYRYRTYA